MSERRAQPSPEISVIVVTYNRADVLSRSLEALYAQETSPSHYQVVVVDDGSTDGTAAILQAWAGRALSSLKILRQENRGAAAARNAGIQVACGEIVLFLGDDIVVPAGFLRAHLAAHRRWPGGEVCVAGPLRWGPDIRPTPTMRFLLRYAYGYPDSTEPVESDYHLFYGCNTSLKRVFLLSGPLFDESFAGRDYEDVELGYRLSRRGMRLMYDPAAWAFHNHPQDIQALARRWYESGRNSLLYEGRTGQGAAAGPSWIRRGKLLLGSILAPPLRAYCSLADRLDLPLVPPRFYAWLARYYVARGREYARRQGGP